MCNFFQSLQFFRQTSIVFLILALVPMFCFGTVISINPSTLGPFCPGNMELVDKHHAQKISLSAQRQIQNSIKEFLKLEAEARRGGNPLGIADYWKRGLTNPFEYKSIPPGWISYIDWKYLNVCSDSNKTVAIIALDVGDSYFREKPSSTNVPDFLQKAWDALTKKAIIFPSEKNNDEMLGQSIILREILLIFNADKKIWLLDQTQIPQLIKFSSKKLQKEINQINYYHKCDLEKMKSPPSSSCKHMEEMKNLKLKLNRPAWVVDSKLISSKN